MNLHYRVNARQQVIGFECWLMQKTVDNLERRFRTLGHTDCNRAVELVAAFRCRQSARVRFESRRNASSDQRS